MKSFLAIGALALASVLAVGCSSSPSTSTPAPSASGGTYPITLSASNGSVTIKSKPDRIISLSPTGTEDLYAVGAGSQVVAVDSDSDYPASAPVTSLSGLTPNVEAIAKYRPDLVIAAENSDGLVSGLAKLGVPVLIEPPAANLAGAYQQIDQIGQATGHFATAEQKVASMKSSIAASVASVASVAQAGHKDLT
jgi:iron complex transport system substrate-binding protein